MNKKEEISMLFEEYKNCEKCSNLCSRRKQVVFGSGNIAECDLLIVDEAPGALEDDHPHAEPLINYTDDRRGPSAGVVLDSALEAAGIARNSVYVTQVVLCRPTLDVDGKQKGREPTNEEVDACQDRLYKEIYIADPKLVVLMGKKAAAFATASKVEKALGAIFELELPGRTEGSRILYPAIVTWRPSYVLSIGIAEPKPGTVCQQFFDTFSTAAKLINVSRKISQGVSA